MKQSEGHDEHFAPILAALDTIDRKVVETTSKSTRSVSFTDDHLDAFIAWSLGVLWTRQHADDPSVVLVGDLQTGAMLLPVSDVATLDLGARFRDAKAIATANREERCRN